MFGIQNSFMSLHGSSGFIIWPTDPNDAQALHKILTHPKVAGTLLQLPSMEFARTEEFIQEQTLGIHRLIAEKIGQIIAAAANQLTMIMPASQVSDAQAVVRTQLGVSISVGE